MAAPGPCGARITRIRFGGLSQFLRPAITVPLPYVALALATAFLVQRSPSVSDGAVSILQGLPFYTVCATVGHP